MVRFLRLWHHVELRSLRNSAVAIVVVPLFFIIPGALFLGRASWTAKLIVLQIGIWIATILLVWLAKRRLVIGSELATALNMIEPRKRKTITS
jgi:surface polysaccharide O-acyltransferase-like enzyme